MRKFVLSLALLCAATVPASAAINPFIGLPTGHWVYGAFSDIARASGADYSIRDDMNRYDCALVLANIFRDVNILSPREIAVCKTATFEKLVLELEPTLGVLGLRSDSHDWRFSIRLRSEELERILARHSIKDRAYEPVAKNDWARDVVRRMIFLNSLNTPPPRRGSPEEAFYRESKPLNVTNRYRLAARFIGELRHLSPLRESVTGEDLALILAFFLEFWDELDVVSEYFDKAKAYADLSIRYKDQYGFLPLRPLDAFPEEILRRMKQRGVPPLTPALK